MQLPACISAPGGVPPAPWPLPTNLILCSTIVIRMSMARAGANFKSTSQLASCSQEASPDTCTPEARPTPAGTHACRRAGREAARTGGKACAAWT
jgi:hypothetical protein